MKISEIKEYVEMMIEESIIDVKVEKGGEPKSGGEIG